MRGLAAVLYLLVLGWAFSHYGLDRQMAEAAHKALRGLMREGAEISLEVHAGRYELAPQIIWPSKPTWAPAVLPGSDGNG